jgi:hypothetical protein
MKLLTYETDYDKTIGLAKELNGSYDKPVIFHAYWNGTLNEKHFMSVKSCWYFNIKNYSNRKIIVWLENNSLNEWNEKISEFAEINYFNLNSEMENTPLENKRFYYNRQLSFYSDVVRYILLYKYGGCWFDLDVFFLRDFSPLFSAYENEVLVYQWERQNYPNGAIYISLVPQNNKIKDIIEFIIKRNKGWGFQEADLTYDLELDMLVLPCSWFDGSWLGDIHFGCDAFFQGSDKIYTFENFFNGGFCYHWHNRWNHHIHENSPIKQLYYIILNDDSKKN